MKRKIISILLCICIFASLLPVISVTASAKTFSEVVAWMDSKNGKALDFDGKWGAQCVDYFNYYLKEVWGISNPINKYPVKYAKQIFDYAAPSGWQKISGSGNYRVGDVIIWNGTSSSVSGHVGIVYSVSGSTVKVSQQNYNKMMYVTVQNLHSPNLIRGVFRPPLEEDKPVNLPAHATTQNVLPGTYRLINASSGYYMNYAVGGLSGVSGYKPIIMSKPDDTPEQNFRLEYVSAGKYALKITHSEGGAVNIYRGSGSTQAGDPLSQWSYSGSDYQLFYITPVSGGYILQSASNPNMVVATPNNEWHAQLKLAKYVENDKKQIWTLDFPNKLPFVDAESGKYYWDALRWAYYCNITGGTDATHFSPNAKCTREQVMTFIWTAYGKPEPKSTANPFKDVKAGKYYVKPILWAVENGITGGVSDDKFGVGETCTRAQVVTFLYAAAGRPITLFQINPFKDVKTTDYFYKPVLWALQKGVTGGTSTTTFGPNETCTRAQVVTFLYNAVAK